MKRFLLTAILCLLAWFAKAGEIFTYTYQGQTLNYEVVDENSCRVGDNTKIGGDVVIPVRAEYKDKQLNVVSIGPLAFVGSYLTNISLPEGLRTIGDSAFLYCNNLVSAHLPSTIEAIGNSAFLDCYKLEELTLPEGLKKIGDLAFRYCAVKEVVIPNSVENIGKGAYYGCNMTKVSIGKSVKEIGADAFINCLWLTEANFADLESLCNIKFGGLYSNPIFITHKVIVGDRELTEITFPMTATEIQPFVFAGANRLTKVDIHDNVTKVGQYAFYSCSGLTELTIPNSVKEIGVAAFLDCRSLDSVRLSSSLLSIEERLFRGCRNLKEIVIPETVEKIANSAFYDSGLTKIEIPEKVTAIEQTTFCNCAQLKEINIKGVIKYIGEAAFSGCYYLQSIDLKEGLTSIGKMGFMGCISFKQFTFPSTVTEIGDKAFDYCDALSEIYSKIEEPFECTPGFYITVYSQATLYVPQGTLSAYQNVNPWNNFVTIKDTLAGVGDVEADEIDGPTEVYTLNGVRIGNTTEGLPRGIYLVRQGNKITKTAVR